MKQAAALLQLAYKTLETWYRNYEVDWLEPLESEMLFYLLMRFNSDELIAMGYDVNAFTSKEMDSELERAGAMSHFSPVGMDYDSDNDTFVYWIDPCW